VNEFLTFFVPELFLRFFQKRRHGNDLFRRQTIFFSIALELSPVRKLAHRSVKLQRQRMVAHRKNVRPFL